MEAIGTHLRLVQELDWDADGASELAHFDGMCDAGRGDRIRGIEGEIG